jgi:hypothetical protein
MQGISGIGQLETRVQKPRTATSYIAKRLRSFGPYIFIELLLPGGTLIALLMFLYRQGGTAGGDAVSEGAVGPFIAVTRVAAGFRWLWCERIMTMLP